MSIYEGFAKAETGGVKGSKYVRTSEIPAEGSTAYGPVQITLRLAKDYKDNHASKFTADQLDYLDRFLAQAAKFNTYGNNPAYNTDTTTLPGYDKKYDYGGAGDLTSAADQKLYEEVAKVMLTDVVANNPNDLQGMANEWHFGAKGALTKGRDQHVDYSNRLLKEFSRLNPKSPMAKTVDEIAGIEATDDIREKLPDFDTLPDNLKTALVASVKHDDTILKSPTALGLIAKGRYAAASTEFLNNRKYDGKKATPKNKRAMKALADVLDTASDDNEAQLSELPTATSEDTPTSSSQPLSEDLAPTPTPSIPQENVPQTKGEEVITPEQRAIVDEMMREAELGSALATEDSFLAGQEAPTTEQQSIIDEMMLSVGGTVEGIAGREERLQAEFDSAQEEEALDNLF